MSTEGNILENCGRELNVLYTLITGDIIRWMLTGNMGVQFVESCDDVRCM